MMNQCVCVYVCVRTCVYVLRILIMKDNILPFSNYNARIYNFL
jgi:hypothetical protein